MTRYGRALLALGTAMLAASLPLTANATPSNATLVAGADPAAGVTVGGSTVAPASTITRVVRALSVSGDDHVTDPIGYPNYVTEGYLGWIETRQVYGSHPIYQCSHGIDYFTSTQANCEGRTFHRRIGYLFDAPLPNAFSHPLYRCRVAGNGDHFDSYKIDCEGEIAEAILGFTA